MEYFELLCQRKFNDAYNSKLERLYDIGCDVVGVRGAACVGGDRNTGHIDRTAVAELKELVKSFEE